MHPYLMIMRLSLLMTAFIPASDYLSITANDYWDIGADGFSQTFRSKQAQKHVFWIGKEIQLFYHLHNLLIIIGLLLPMIIRILVPMDLAKHSCQNKPKNMFFG